MSPFMRKATFLTTNLVLGFPIRILLRCLRRFALFDYIFLIYPGDNSDIEGFCPLWLARTPLISRRPLIGGIITGKSRGLLLGVPNTAEEFRSNPETARIVMERVLRIQKLVGAKSVALAGRLPGVLERQGMEIKSPVVMGVKGTLFSVIETINLAAKKHALEPSRTRIGIVGVGNIGQSLLEHLAKQGWNVFGVDMRAGIGANTRTGEIFYGQAALKALGDADIVVALTPTGADFEPYLKHLRSDAIVLDDTHPMIRKRPKGISFYKVAVGMDGVRFRPKLPGYRRNWMPGCAVEATVVANTLNFDMDQMEFNKAANDLGLRALLV